ncbi:hypothetical protein [Streptomyces sp. NPDC060243]|uniref:hypothetical protein n=1 Tax=Streptomyces sp. NPDC060243 TaxID=3347081 RepID=UPI00364C8CC5
MQVATLGPVKVNLDDVQDLQTLLAEKTGEAVRISAGSYDAETVSDLSDADDIALASVVLSVPAKSFTVNMGLDGANVVCDSPDRDLLDLVQDVAAYVNGKPISRRIAYPPALVVCFLLSWSGIFGCSVFAVPPKDQPVGYWCAGLITLFTLAMVWYLPRSWKARGAVEIVPLRRHEIRRRRFDSSNSLWSGVAGAVIGALIGAGATLAAVYLGKG